MFGKVKKTIFSKILILSISVSLVLGTVIFAIALIELIQNLEEFLIQESKLFTHNLAEDIEAGYLLRTLPDPSTESAELFKEFLFLWVVQPNGEIYFADRAEMVGKIVKDPSLGTSTTIVKDSVSIETGEKIKVVVHSLQMGTEKPWTLFVGVSLESIRAARTRATFIGFGLFGLSLILLVIIVFYLARKISKPIKELERGAEIIGRGNLDYQIKIKTGDEVEELASAFNKMAKNLRKYYSALREEELKTSTVFTNFSDGLLVFDKKDNLVLLNPRVKDFFGKKSENLTGKPIKEVFKVLKINVSESLVDLYKKDKDLFRKKLELRDDLTLEITTISLITDGEKLGTLITLHDVTRERLVEKSKTEFVSLAAHQLRTPLAAIKWITKMLLDGTLGKINKEQKEFLQDSYKSNERMIYLINDLLNAARIEEGKYLDNIVPTDIQDVIQITINLYKQETERKNIEIVFEKPQKRVPKIMADVEKLKIAIGNILDNAVIYNLQGEKTTVSLKYIDKEIEVSIKDKGIGIPKKDQERIFRKFFRSNKAIKKETRGNGLGLYISKNIIEAHGGKIWFKTKENQGTTFFFTLPIDYLNEKVLK